jgi:transcriptional regulator with XRE-family HTH domain
MMEKDEITPSMKATSDFIVEMMMDEKEGEEFTREYLKDRFLSSVVRGLYDVRRQAGLTQAQVAERLNTKQAAIARLEADTDGSMSLHRYVDYALACGMIPHHITFAPIESARDYVIAQPKMSFTQEAHNVWLKKVSDPSQVPQPVIVQAFTTQTSMNATLPTSITISAQEGKQEVMFTEQFLRDNRQESQTLFRLSNESTTNVISRPQASTLAQPTASQLEGNRYKVAA